MKLSDWFWEWFTFCVLVIIGILTVIGAAVFLIVTEGIPNIWKKLS